MKHSKLFCAFIITAVVASGCQKTSDRKKATGDKNAPGVSGLATCDAELVKDLKAVNEQARKQAESKDEKAKADAKLGQAQLCEKLVKTYDKLEETSCEDKETKKAINKDAVQTLCGEQITASKAVDKGNASGDDKNAQRAGGNRNDKMTEDICGEQVSSLLSQLSDQRKEHEEVLKRKGDDREQSKVSAKTLDLYKQLLRIMPDSCKAKGAKAAVTSKQMKAQCDNTAAVHKKTSKEDIKCEDTGSAATREPVVQVPVASANGDVANAGNGDCQEEKGQVFSKEQNRCVTKAALQALANAPAASAPASGNVIADAVAAQKLIEQKKKEEEEAKKAKEAAAKGDQKAVVKPEGKKDADDKKDVKADAKKDADDTKEADAKKEAELAIKKSSIEALAKEVASFESVSIKNVDFIKSLNDQRTGSINDRTVAFDGKITKLNELEVKEAMSAGQSAACVAALVAKTELSAEKKTALVNSEGTINSNGYKILELTLSHGDGFIKLYCLKSVNSAFTMQDVTKALGSSLEFKKKEAVKEASKETAKAAPVVDRPTRAGM